MAGIEALKVAVLYGSVRQDRQGIRAARFIEARLKARGHDVTLVDPMELRLPLLDRMYKEHPKGEAPEPLERLATLYRAADAFVIVTGEYNHSVPPALSNLLDHFLEEYFWRPSAIVCYSAGAFGGVRGAVAARTMLGELGMPPIPSILPVPKVQAAIGEDGEPADGGGGGLDRRAARFIDELEWYADALRAKRAGGVPY